MAKKLYKSNSNFTLRRLHQSGNYGNIYERDYLTITNTGANPEGQIPIYSTPSFKMTVRGGFNGQKIYFYGDLIQNICRDTQTGSWITGNTWTLSCMPTPNKKDSQIQLKPNTHRITDFVCYSSASELLRTSIRNILYNFPAEIYVDNSKVNDLLLIETKTILPGSELYNEITNNKNLYVIDNPLYIDITQSTIPEDSEFPELKYFCKNYQKYQIISGNTSEDITSWSVTSSEYIRNCFTNGNLLATVNIRTSRRLIIIYVYYLNDTLLYLTETPNFSIRPNAETVDNFFNNLNDFESVLLNRLTKYSAKFETYIEDDENGWHIFEKEYKWPLSKGEWNISTNGIDYENYVESLNDLIYGYDENFTNSIWRDMTHDAIVNMDLTLNRNGNEIETPNSTKVKQLVNIIGRQFDEIKKYADNIKSTGNVSYDGDSNTPDYFLTDNLELSGWETQSILKNISEDIVTDAMYGGRNIGFTANDANNEFLRRLILNTKYIFNKKGTVRGIEELMAIFGYHSKNWLTKYYNGAINNATLTKAFEIKEENYVLNPLSDTSVIQNIKYINSLKNEFIDDDIGDTPINPYQGLPVAEAYYNGNTYLIPWFDKNLTYDNNSYFHMKGGWAKNMKTNKYGRSVSNIFYFKTKNDITYNILNEEYYYYVDNEDKIYIYNRGELIEYNGTLDSIKNQIIDNNKGNNPHSGNYDDGSTYLNLYNNLFTNSSFSEEIIKKLQDEDKNMNVGFRQNVLENNKKCCFVEDGDVFDSLYKVNSKKIMINFDITHRDFLEENVIPFIKQIIPSTTIFHYDFINFSENNATVEEYGTACKGGICPVQGKTE